MVTADGPQFAQTSPEYIIGDGNGREGLGGLVCDGTRRWGKTKTHVIKKIDQSSQLLSLKASRILFIFIVPNQDIQNAQEIWR
jgi:hypothetical protein